VTGKHLPHDAEKYLTAGGTNWRFTWGRVVSSLQSSYLSFMTHLPFFIISAMYSS
jgi:hypothetical protein